MSADSYLNLISGDTFARFQLAGLTQAEDGTLTLTRLPRLADNQAPAALPGAFDGPAGLAMDEQGTLWLSDPAGHQIFKREACSSAASPAPCFGRQGSQPGQFNTPRGLLAGPRDALYIADSVNHRIQVIDRATWQVRAIWGQPEPFGGPQPGQDPGQFNTPWGLAADSQSAIYVVDYGNQRVQKFTVDGQVIAAFWEHMQAQAVVPARPALITVARLDGAERLLLLDQQGGGLLVYDLEGGYDTERSHQWRNLWQPAGADPARISALVYSQDRLYASDAGRGLVLIFSGGAFLGSALGFTGPALGLALGPTGSLLVHTGGGEIQVLLVEEAYAAWGSFVAGPYELDGRAIRWSRLEARPASLPAGTHLQLFTLTSDTAMPPPALPALASPDSNLLPPATIDLTPADQWRPAPRDALSLPVLNAPGRYLWIAARFNGDGLLTPSLAQLRVTCEDTGLAGLLPGIYRENPEQPSFLGELLALLQSFLDEKEAQLDDLPLLFDPLSVPGGESPAWLDTLAGWLALERDQTLAEDTQRGILAQAFALHGRRGTVEGLQALIRLQTGAQVRIVEPALAASLWALGETSTLGFDTMLCPAPPEGAVLDTTAKLDNAHLLEDEAFGSPLYDDLAWSFTVEVLAPAASAPPTMAKIRALIEQEKPAHMVYQVCPVEARMRVGFQARLGIDSIVAAAGEDFILDADREIGLNTHLAPSSTPPVTGSGLRLGVNSTIS